MSIVMKKKMNYSIALDIGNTSVGWAVIDENNNLLKHRGRNMWGVRLFEEGQTAATRRNFRATRRRLLRRRQRLDLLQELLAQDVLAKDESFFMKLKESFLVKGNGNKIYNLFNDSDFTDQNFYDKYPTIYHLRYKLITNKEKEDIRLVYLALHHIIKYRGNFLYEGQTFNIQDSTIITDLENLLEYLKENFEYDIEFTKDDLKEVEKILTDSSVIKSDKVKKASEVFKADKDSQKVLKEVFKAVLGNKFDFLVICNLGEVENQEDYKTNLSDEEKEQLFETLLGDHFEVYSLLKNIYSSIILREILGTDEEGKVRLLSQAMINRYDDFKKDLTILKRLIKEHFKGKYNYIFREVDDKTPNYYNYMNRPGKTSQIDFYNFLKKVLNQKREELADNDDYKYCIKRIEDNNFLLRQRIKVNAAIPYQIHKQELIAILENQAPYYETIRKNKDKIISLLEFRIPYYVGPLNYDRNNNKYAWVVRKKNGEKIYPWNFEEVVDVKASAEEFIRRMTNKCTYLPKEDVLPKYSLILMEFNVLDELNKITINGDKLSYELKLEIIEECFKKYKIVRESHLVKVLRKYYKYYNSEKLDIRGYRKEKQFAGSLTSYIDFTNIFGEVNDSNFEMIETIIKWITIFQDKKILKEKIKENYPEITDAQLKKILALNYSGWGRLSRKLIYGITTPDQSGLESTILHIMRKTNQNFMQVINSNKYCFAKKIEKIQKESIQKKEKVTLADVQDIPGSPAIKKAIWQAIKIVNEIIKIMKCDPQNIYIENTRSSGKKERTRSRVTWLKECYKKLKVETDIYNQEVARELNEHLETIDNEKLFLYFIQNGKCMYSGETLDPQRLIDYEVDHIIPRSLIKDDSIDNKVLVLKKYNQLKADRDVLPYDIISKMKPYWEKLKDCGLISNKKFYNLCRKEFNEEDIAGFINRQIVETSQIVKHVVNLLYANYPNTKIHTIRPLLVSILREQLSLYKVRDINDYHHAHDAYLTGCVANFIRIRYPKLEKEILYSEYLRLPTERRKYNSGFIVNSFVRNHIDDTTGEVVWDANEQISKIKKVLNYKDCFITKKVEESTGVFYNQTLVGPNKATAPIRASLDPKIYGGYTNVNIAYMVALEYRKGTQMKKVLAGIPIMFAQRFKRDQEALIEYLKEQFRTNEIIILKPKILKSQLVDFDGHLLYLASSEEFNNAKQLILDYEFNELVYLIDKDKLSESDENHKRLNKFYQVFIEKLEKHYPFYQNIARKFKNATNDFEKLDFTKKCKFVLEMLKITQANSTNAYFKNFGIDNLGDRMDRLNGKTLDFDKTIFIDQSVTGMYEKRYRL